MILTFELNSPSICPTKGFGNGVLALSRHPQEMARLWRDPGLVAPAVEEMLRYDSPVQLIHRQVMDDLEVGGLREVVVRADNLVVLVYVLNSEYFLACAIKPEANTGKARYLLRLMAPQIQSEL